MKVTLTAVFVVIFFAASAFAQGGLVPGYSQSACGAPGVNFDTETSTAQPPAQPEPGKALVFVAEDYPTTIGSPTIRVSLDGAWIGATHHRSYLFFSVDPGEHHVCIRWQSRLARFSNLASFARLTAEAGKTYYFRARVLAFNVGGPVYLDLEAIDPDEGQYLVATSLPVASHPKK